MKRLNVLIPLLLAGCAPEPVPVDPAKALVAKAPPPAPVPAPCAEDAGWDDPTPPRRIFGVSWYVGSCGVSAVVIRTDAGAILLDGTTKGYAPHIRDALIDLGIGPRDLKYILLSHEHHDHAGGLAFVQQWSGAPVLTRAPAVAALRRGRTDRSDPQFAVGEAMPPVETVQVVADGEAITLGNVTVTAIATPGHTPGGTSWRWRQCDKGGVCHDLVYVESLSLLSDAVFRYSDAPALTDAYSAALSVLAAAPCTIALTTHPQASDLIARLDGEAPLIDAEGCRTLAARGQDNLKTRLAKEAAGVLP